MRTIIRILLVLLIVYLLLCLAVYTFQEKLIFFPEKLKADHKFEDFEQFTELHIPVAKDTRLNGLLFKTPDSKGLIFYLHGNAGSLQNWGTVAETYNDVGYDTFVLDYRGYGKSEGKITSEDQMYSDVQIAYNHLKRLYREKDIIVLGYSIGTGPAAKLASTNNPKLLILQAPYYSLIDMMTHRFPIFPSILLKYKFETNKYIVNCKMPIIMFHGTHDNVIPYSESLKLKTLLKPVDTLITLDGEGHNGMTSSPAYIDAIQKIMKD